MTFTYTFRNSKGILESGLINAPDRRSALEQLRTSGISVIQLKEGASKPSVSRGGERRRGLLAYFSLAFLVCIAAVIFLLMRSKPTAIGEEPTNVHTQPRVPHVHETVVPLKGKVLKKQKEVVKTQQAAASEKRQEATKEPGVFAPDMLRLPNGMELRFKLPEKGQVRELVAGGEIWEIDSEGNIVNKTPPPIFEKPFEAGLSSLIERDGKVLPFILDNVSEADAVKMCKEPTLTYDDDTSEITKMRENVAMMKSGALAYIQHGGKFSDFIKEMREFSQTEQRLHIEGLRKVHEYVKNGQVSEALAYFDQYSRELKENGYSGIKIPKFIQKQMLSNGKE